MGATESDDRKGEGGNETEGGEGRGGAPPVAVGGRAQHIWPGAVPNEGSWEKIGGQGDPAEQKVWANSTVDGPTDTSEWAKVLGKWPFP